MIMLLFSSQNFSFPGHVVGQLLHPTVPTSPSAAASQTGQDDRVSSCCFSRVVVVVVVDIET